MAKGPYVGPKTQLGPIVANESLDLLCVDFTTMDPSRDGKKNVLVLTDTFFKFSQAFVTPNQKTLAVAKIKWTNGSMSMEYLPEYIVTQVNLLKMLFWSICIPCTELSNPQPHLTIHIEIPPVRGLTICSTIY